MQWLLQQEEEDCSCVEKSTSELENELTRQVREHGDELFPCGTAGYASRVLLKDKDRLQLQYALNDQLWRAASDSVSVRIPPACALPPVHLMSARALSTKPRTKPRNPCV